MNDSTPGLDRLQALLAWWGYAKAEPGNGAPSLATLSDAIAMLQRGYFDALARNTDATLAAQDRLSRAGAEMLRAKTLSDIAQIQDGIFAALSEAAATHNNNWNDFQRLLVEVMGDGWAKRAAALETPPPLARSIPIGLAPAAQQPPAKPEPAKRETSKPVTATAA